MDEIRRIRGLAVDSTTIYVNQRLLIRNANPITPTHPVNATAKSTQNIISSNTLSEVITTSHILQTYLKLPASSFTGTASDLTVVKSVNISTNSKALILPGILLFLAAGRLMYWV